MVDENIRVTQPNFCIAPLVGTYASIDTTNIDAYLRIKNSTGDSSATYTFNPNIPQNTSIKYLDYIGPRGLSTIESGMLFVTLQSSTSAGTCKIDFWKFDKDNSRLNLDYTVTKSTTGYEVIKTNNIAVERQYLELSNTTVTGTNLINLNSTAGLEVGNKLFLGPSSNTTYLYAYEEVEITSISGTYVYITSDKGVPPFSYYNSGDPVTYLGDIYLFNDVGYGNLLDTGSQYRLDIKTGVLKSYINSAIYRDIATANYGTPFFNTVAIVKYSQLLYVDKDEGIVIKSCRLQVIGNMNVDIDDIITIESISFTSSEIYRLQIEKLIKDDTGNYGLITWSTYNYINDTIYKYVDSINMFINDVGWLKNNTLVTLDTMVRDQYGVGIANQVVHFDHDGSDIGLWSDPNKQATTDIDGYCSINYTSAWYDQSDFTDVNEVFLFSAYTNGSNVQTGSIYCWVYTYAFLKPKFFMKDLMKLIDNDFYSSFYLTSLFEFSATLFPKFLGDFESRYWVKTNYKVFGPEYNHDPDFISTFYLTQQESFESTYNLDSNEEYNDVTFVSQTYVSRHLPVGSNEDDVDIAQFRFILDVLPPPFSEKNNRDTDIWFRLAPYGFSLNKSTLVLKVREQSYAGDTGYIDYSDTEYLTITEFDSGGGLLGLEVLLNLPEPFHSEAVVHVYLEVYDLAIPPNLIYYDYYFYVIADYLAPVVINEIPARSSNYNKITTNIEFDIIDMDVGVNINSLELFINNRVKTYHYNEIVNGYHVIYEPEELFLYNQRIEIAIRIEDSSNRKNVLYDSWYFFCEGSKAPEVEVLSFEPKTCSRGLPTRIFNYSCNVLDKGDGIAIDTLVFNIDGVTKKSHIKPFVRLVTEI
jgi:hypothetical protein